MKDSILFRFISYAVISITVILILFATYNYNATKNFLTEQKNVQVQQIQNRLEINAPSLLWNYETSKLNVLLESELKSDYLSQLIVTDTSGKVVANYSKNLSGSIFKTEKNPTMRSEVMESSLNHNDSGENKKVGDVKLVIDNRSIENALSAALFRQITQTLLIDVVIILLYIFLLKRFVLTPLNNVNSALENIVEGDGDLTMRIDVSREDEFGQLSKNFNKFVSDIHKLLTDAMTLIDQVSSNFGQMKQASQDGLNCVGDQNNETDHIARSINEMGETSKEIARNAAGAADAACSANDAGSQAQEVVALAVTLVESLANDIGNSFDVINELENNVSEIGSVLDVIRGIAEQTNLLALNAAIEAARAGEQGRGFAVVADEVRTLASRTQESTEEINKMIERLQKAAHDAVHYMDISKENGLKTVDQATIVDGAIGKIVSHIGNINAMNTQIATAAEQQAVTTDQMNHSVTKVVEIAGQTSQSVTTTHDLSGVLEKMSSDLRSMMNHFTI